MDNQQVVEIIQAIGLPTALSIYLLITYNKHMDKYHMDKFETLIDKIAGEIKILNDIIKNNQQDK